MKKWLKKPSWPQKLNAKQGMSKFLINRALSKMSKEEFLEELETTWYLLFQTQKGSIDIDQEVISIKERLKKSGNEFMFDKLGVTIEDLKETLSKVVAAFGRDTKGELDE